MEQKGSRDRTIERVYQELDRRGFPVRKDLIIEVPSDGCLGHMGIKHWRVFAVRFGEFTLLAYVYDDGHIRIITA